MSNGNSKADCIDKLIPSVLFCNGEKSPNVQNVFAVSALIETDQIFSHRLGLAIISQISLRLSRFRKNVCSIDLSNAEKKIFLLSPSLKIRKNQQKLP